MARTKGWRLIRKAAEEFPGFIPPLKSDKLRAHPSTKAMHNRMTQPLQPLAFPLQSLPKPDTTPLTPLGGTTTFPFHVDRTHTGNLPVYSDLSHAGTQQRTIIRKLTGDVQKFKDELSKVVSNAPIYTKVGRLEVKGLHVPVVKLWLRRLGF